MQTANAVKIGVWIVIAVAIVVFGTRFFQGLALGGSTSVVATFERVDGLISGNPVQMRGVRIGAVTGISVNKDETGVEVRMSINKNVSIREGSVAHIAGIPALGDMKIDIVPGPVGNPVIADGGEIETAVPVDLIKKAQEAADEYMASVSDILDNAEQTMSELSGSFEKDGNLGATLTALRSMSQSLDALLSREATHLSNTIRNFERMSANLDTLTSADVDSGIVATLQQSLDQLDLTLSQTRSLTANLDSILVKVNEGRGTLGLLANDPSLYHHMDSVAVNLSRLLEDFRRDPKRYLAHVKAVEIF